MCTMVPLDRQSLHTYTPPSLPANSALPGSTTFYHYHHPAHRYSNNNSLLSTVPASRHTGAKEHLELLRTRQLGGLHYATTHPKSSNELQIFFRGALPEEEPNSVQECARVTDLPASGFRESLKFRKQIELVNSRDLKAVEAYGRPAPATPATFNMVEKTKNWHTYRWYEFTLPVFNVPMKWAQSDIITPDPARPTYVPRKGWFVDDHKALVAEVKSDRMGRPLSGKEETEHGGIVCARLVRPIDCKEDRMSYYDESRIELVWEGLERVLGSGWDLPEVVESILLTGALVDMKCAQSRQAASAAAAS